LKDAAEPFHLPEICRADVAGEEGDENRMKDETQQEELTDAQPLEVEKALA